MGLLTRLTQPTIDKLNSWIRQRKYKKDVYYRIASETEHSGIMPIELLKGPFKGIIYSYGTINVGEDLGIMGAQASFDIEIIKGPQNILENESFAKISGQVLLTILEIAIKNQAEVFLKGSLDEENREDYIEEPVPQRTVRKKNPTVPKTRVSSGKVGKKSVRRSTKLRSPVQSDTDV